MICVRVGCVHRHRHLSPPWGTWRTGSGNDKPAHGGHRRRRVWSRKLGPGKRGGESPFSGFKIVG